MKGLTPDLLESTVVIQDYECFGEISLSPLVFPGCERDRDLLTCLSGGVLKSLLNLSPFQEPGLEHRAEVTGSPCPQDAGGVRVRDQALNTPMDL